MGLEIHALSCCGAAPPVMAQTRNTSQQGPLLGDPAEGHGQDSQGTFLGRPVIRYEEKQKESRLEEKREHGGPKVEKGTKL